MKLEALIGDLTDLPNDAASIEISGLTANSAKVESGFLFFGLPGVNVDGAHYAVDAVKAGASFVIVSKGSTVEEISAPLLRVDDPRLVLAQVAARFYSNQPKVIAAVTGTAGKTSVATFLRQIWEADSKQAASLGTTGVVAPGRDDYGNLTTPDPVSLHKLLDELAISGVTHAAMEASSHGLDQHRLDGVKLSVTGFTNLGRDHMDYHETVDEYLKAKLRLFTEVMPEGETAVIFADDEYSKQFIDGASAAGCDVKTVGRKGEFLSLKKVEHQQFGQSVQLVYEDAHYLIDFPLAGDFQIANGLVAAGMALCTGTSPDVVFRALSKLKGASGRLELVGRSAKGAPAYVDYAHKPDALENVLNSLRPFTSGRIILVFGCGGDRDTGKRPIMGAIAQKLADIVIVTDDNPRNEDAAQVRAEILAACDDGIEIGDREKAILEACELLEDGDCLVVAGKGHEPGQIVGDKVFPFSDHEVLRKALGVDAA